MDWSRLARVRAARIVAAAATALVAAVAVVGVWEYRAGRDQLLEVLGDQAATLQRTIGAAAHANRLAAERAEAELGQRLLDNARMLAELDRLGHLDSVLLGTITRQHRLFRVTVYDEHGGIAHTSHDQSVLGHGANRAGSAGIPPWVSATTATEAVTPFHRSRWGEARLAAAVRRPSGGVVIVAADATAIADLQRPYSLDSLLAAIQRTSHNVAFLKLDLVNERITHGAVPPQPVLEVAAPVDLGGRAPATLTLGMRLDEVRDAERRMVLRLAASLSGVLALSLAAVGFVWLRHEHGDLSARHARAQETLRRHERQAAVGALAATVAHEIRNPLNGIAMSVQRLRREFPGGAAEADAAAWVELTEVLESETKRLNARVQQFMEFARPARPTFRPVRASSVVSDVVAAMRALADSRHVRLEDAVDETAETRLDPDQLRQALENIVRNAIEATPEGGAVRVRSADARDNVRIEVADAGPGIPVEHLPRIFDLYFSTKPGGSGIGLAIARQVVAAHGGTIEVDSTPATGTRMTVHLPRREDQDG